MAWLGKHEKYCYLNLEEIGWAMRQYSADYDGKLPASSTKGVWVNSISPYTKSLIFHCPVQIMNGTKYSDSPKSANFIDYFYNSQLENKKLPSLSDISRLILVGEGNDGNDNADAHYAKNSIPAAWRRDHTSPSFRHHGAANYLFADGHIRQVPVKDIVTAWKTGAFCFQPRKLSGK